MITFTVNDIQDKKPIKTKEPGELEKFQKLMRNIKELHKLGKKVYW